MDPYEPSSDEKAFYYHGLRRHLKLIARTSGTLWSPSSGLERPRLPKKRFGCLDQHPIVQAWSRVVENALIRVLVGSNWKNSSPPE
jgi:hypothetical protein